MNLHLDTVRLRGNVEVPLAVSIERPLTPADLVKLAAHRHTQPSALKRISDRHHALARLLASGMKSGDAALMAGYIPSRVSILQGDPTFKELVEFYRSSADRQMRGVTEKLTGIAQDAMDLIEERLDDPKEREKIGMSTAIELVKLGTDRTGFGPQSSQTTVNIHVGLAGRLEAARRRAQDASRTIEGQVLPSSAVNE